MGRARSLEPRQKGGGKLIYGIKGQAGGMGKDPRRKPDRWGGGRGNFNGVGRQKVDPKGRTREGDPTWEGVSKVDCASKKSLSRNMAFPRNCRKFGGLLDKVGLKSLGYFGLSQCASKSRTF